MIEKGLRYSLASGIYLRHENYFLTRMISSFFVSHEPKSDFELHKRAKYKSNYKTPVTNQKDKYPSTAYVL